MKSFRVLHGKHRQLPDRRVFFEYDLALAVRIYFERVALADTHRASYFFGNNDSSEIVYTSDNTGSFHFYDTFLCFFRGRKNAPFDLHMM